MILGVDASNIRGGGGVTHLIELLRAADPVTLGFFRVVVWGGYATISRIEDRPWLVKSHQPLLDKCLPYRTFWQRFKLSSLARAERCDVLFIPGGSYSGNFQPVVALSQNLLPFEWCELRRFGWSWMTLKLILLRMTQGDTFKRAAGLIFLTKYAQNVILRVIKKPVGKTTIIPHGIDERFVCVPREQMDISFYSVGRPFYILYVSTVDVYKHQWYVAEAVAHLRKIGLPVDLDLVGPAYPPALTRLQRTLDQIDQNRNFMRYNGIVPYDEIQRYYMQADMCLFASSCENMPNILLEGMASGLPCACSNRGPMPEVLGKAGIYFDPESSNDIARALLVLIESAELRAKLAKDSFQRSKVYSWQRCARETFGFLAEVANKSARK